MRRATALALCAGLLYLVGPSAASAAVLYDQTNGNATGSVPSLFNGQSSTPNSELTGPCGIESGDTSCYAIDDFTIPPGPAWNVTNVHVDGQGGAGDILDWSAVQGTGLPTPAPYEEGPFEFGLGTPYGSGTSQTASAAGGDFDLGTGEPPFNGAALPPGHYWLSVYAAPTFTPPSGGTPGKYSPPPSKWMWETRAPANGSAGAWTNRACGSQYVALPGCGQSGPDFRFRIEGEPIDSGFSGLKLGKALRTPDGGVNIQATLAGLPERPGLTVKKVKGKGGIYITVKEGWSIVKKVPAPTGILPNGEVPAVIKIRPEPRLALALRDGKMAKMTLAVRYARRVNGVGVTAPTNTAKVKVVLKKKR